MVDSIFEQERKRELELKNVNKQSDKAWQWVKNSIWDILVAVLALVYVATGLIEITETGRTVGEILATGSMAFLFGFTISTLFAKKGLMEGMTDPRVLETELEHDQVYQEALPYIRRADQWCEIENKAALKLVRERILAKAALSYTDYFDDQGKAKEVEFPDLTNLSKYQLAREKGKQLVVKRAIEAKITYLSISDLISDGTDSLDPNNLGMSKAEYERKQMKSNLIGRIIPALIIGYFGISATASADIGNFIWTALQALLFVAMGYLKKLSAYYFVVDDDRKNTKKKTSYLRKFKLWAMNQEAIEHERNRVESGTVGPTEGTTVQPAATTNNPSDAAISAGTEKPTSTRPVRR